MENLELLQAYGEVKCIEPKSDHKSLVRHFSYLECMSLNTLSGEGKSQLALLLDSSCLLNLHSLCILRFGPCDVLGKGSKRSTCML